MVSAKDMVDVIDELYRTRDVVTKDQFEEAVIRADLGAEAARVAGSLEPGRYTEDELETAVGHAMMTVR